MVPSGVGVSGGKGDTGWEARAEVGQYGKDLEAKLKSLHFRLIWAIESPSSSRGVQGNCTLNYPWHRVTSVCG